MTASNKHKRSLPSFPRHSTRLITFVATTIALLTGSISTTGAFSSRHITTNRSSAFVSKTSTLPNPPSHSQQTFGNILILDHLNINHEKGRHDLLKAFYFDFLKCAVDPAKGENIDKGKNTLWANIGAQQFHLPEGKPDAQVFDGIITLSFPNIDDLKTRFHRHDIQSVLSGTKFAMEEITTVTGNGIMVTDPWGSKFKIVPAASGEMKDSRGVQKGDDSEGIGMRDLTIYVPTETNFGGIARFYRNVMGAPILSDDHAHSCVVSVGPLQTMTFMAHPDKDICINTHVDLREEPDSVDDGKPFTVSNYGPHVSIYVSDLRSTYKKAEALGVTYVNPRFKRRAYNEEEAVDDCMFRCIEIVDPEDKESGVILKLEHEVRSVLMRNGSRYKSCPFDDVPEDCVI